jgi:inorganic triphosphatase YgiF
MGAALGCSCETKDDQAEISLAQQVQPITNHDGKRQMREVGMSPDDSEINLGDGSVLANGQQIESAELAKED